MISKFKNAVLLSILFGMVSCAFQGERPAVKAQAGLPAPEYHLPRDSWRADHPILVQARLGWGNGEKGFFQVEECLLCHRPDESCNKCHAYVGAALVLGGQGGE